MNRKPLSRWEALWGGAVASFPLTAMAGGCAGESKGCEATRTCSSAKGGGGGEDAGGTDGSGTGGSVQGGSSTSGGDGGSSGAEGGTGASGEAGGGSGGMGSDDTRPTIVSVEPADGATGVRADVNLVITFSERMDPVSTQAAYQSADIPAADVAFSWNAANTVLIVNPNSELAYAAGSLDVVARAFVATITATAEDENGNQLADDFEWGFRTLRRVTQTFSTGEVRAITSNGSNTAAACPTYPFMLGDDVENLGFHRLISRDITDLPDGIVEWESASLMGNQEEVGGTPYDSLGTVRTIHTSFHPPSTATWSGAYLRELAPLSWSAELGTKSVDVLAALVDDYEHRSERMQTSQYRLVFEEFSNHDSLGDTVAFECGSIVLTAQYLIP